MMDKEYAKCSDEQIIGFIRDDDKQALDFLLKKYKPLVIRKARTLYLIGGEMDDLVQEGMIGLYKAIIDFDSQNISSFPYYAELCIGRQLINAIKASNRKKNIPLNTYISFYSYDSDAGENMYPLKDVLADLKNNPEEDFIDKERTNTLKYRLIEKLSKFETDVFDLYIDGVGYNRIAEILGRDAKSIDNAIQRIKKKFLGVIKELDKMEADYE